MNSSLGPEKYYWLRFLSKKFSNDLIKNEVFPEFFLGTPEIILGTHEIILGNTWNIIATFLNNDDDGLDYLNGPLNNEHIGNKIP